MTASPWQTVILAAISAGLPFVLAVSTGGVISYRTAIASVLAAVMTSIANILRSPKQNPPTMIQAKDGQNG